MFVGGQGVEQDAFFGQSEVRVLLDVALPCRAVVAGAVQLVGGAITHAA